MRCIDADALVAKMNLAIAMLKRTMKNFDIEDDPECQMELKAYQDIRDGIKEEPTIEPERETGHWLRTGRNNVFGGFEVECSECGDTVMIMHIEDELYCRHCGAKMEEGEQE